MAPATFRRISTNVPGKRRFIKGFDINPGTFGRIRPKVACENFPSTRPKIFRPSVRFFFFVNLFVFWRFIELQASYRAQIKTVDRSRRPGKKIKCMLGACAPKKLRKTFAKVRSRGRWHARSVVNPPHRCRCPGVLNQYAFIPCFKNLL